VSSKPSFLASFWLALIIAVVLAGSASLVFAADKGQVLAKIGNQTLTESDLKEMTSAMPGSFTAVSTTPEGRQKLLDYLINVYVMAAEAEKEGMDKSPEVQRMLQLNKKDLLARLYFDKATKSMHAPTEADAKAYYDKHKAQFVTPESVHLHHILVKTKKEAEDVLAKLKSGEKFADLAAKVSICPSKAQGGDLGWLPKGKLVKPIEEVAFTMKPGVPVGPVKSKFGYHVLLLDAKRPAHENSFDSVKNYILQELAVQKQQHEYEDLAKTLRKKYNVAFTAAAKAPTAAPATTAPAAKK
jgi:peptidyl-prolyl cis-trans isomerase C